MSEGRPVDAVIRAKGEWGAGYTALTDMNSMHPDLGMDFGILRLGEGETWQDDTRLEKAVLLVYGAVDLVWYDGGAEQSASVSRDNCFDVSPIALHVPNTTTIRVSARSRDSELAVMRVENGGNFASRLYLPQDTPDEYRGAGLMGETSTRIVRTIFDYTTQPRSNMVLGEVIGMPGKWSSYPPHHHPQPEIYYYKTKPDGGFGYAELGDDVYKVRTNDAMLIREGETHPHCAAPGYALWYLWVIRHLPNDPYIKPVFLQKHLWVLDKDAAIPFWNKPGGDTAIHQSGGM